MPPKKLSIARIRAESTLRSDDPDLNRRRPSPSSSSRASQRYRSAAASSSSSSRSNARASSARYKRPAQPKVSARILQIHDDDIQETRVQNRFAPDARTQRQNVSYRPLSLTKQAQRDGAAFQLPTLASMCSTVIATCFDALLPSRSNFDAAAGATTPRSAIRNAHTQTKAAAGRKRSRARAFGSAPDSDEDHQDYVPSDAEDGAARAGSRSTRSRGRSSNAQTAAEGGTSRLLAGWTTSELHYLTRRTSEQLKMLSAAASFLLFRALVEHAPQYLTKTVVADYFLPPVLEGSQAGGEVTAARTHVWLPASIPLLSHDKYAAAFLVNHLTSALTSASQSRQADSSTLSQSVVEETPLAMLPPRRGLVQSASFALRSLQLHALTRLQDATLARFFEAAITSDSQSSQSVLRLETVSLRGCIAIGDRTVGAMCRATGATLRYLNLDYTDVTADSVNAVMRMAPDLHTLKLGYNENLSDKTLSSALQAPTSGEMPFGKLVNLRLRQCAQVGDVGVACFLKYVHRTLEVLDVSGTGVGGVNPHNPDMGILVMGFFPTGMEAEVGLRKINLLDANVDFDAVGQLLERAEGMETLLVRQMPSRSTRDGFIHMLESIVRSRQEGGWNAGRWKKLHVRVVDVADEFAQVFPDLLAVFPVSSPAPALMTRRSADKDGWVEAGGGESAHEFEPAQLFPRGRRPCRSRTVWCAASQAARCTTLGSCLALSYALEFAQRTRPHKHGRPRYVSISPHSKSKQTY